MENGMKVKLLLKFLTLVFCSTAYADIQYLKKYCDRSIDIRVWDDTIRNYKCINEIVIATRSSLEVNDSSKALKISTFGMKNFGFDSRIIKAYRESLTIFKNVLVEMSVRKAPDCSMISSRVSFLKKISPDEVLDINKCNNVPLVVKTTPVIKSQISTLGTDTVIPNSLEVLDVKSPRTNKAIEKTVRGKFYNSIMFQLAEKNQDNFDDVLIHGIKFLDGLEFKSKKIKVLSDDITADQGISVETHAGIYQKKKNKNSLCSEVSKLRVKNSKSGIRCLYLDKLPFNNSAKAEYIKISDKTTKILDFFDFGNGLPSRWVVSLNLKNGNKVLKKFYYLKEGNKISQRYSRKKYSYNFHSSLKHQDGKAIGVKGPRLRIDDSYNSNDFIIQLEDLKMTDLSNVDSLSIKFEPLLTYNYHMFEYKRFLNGEIRKKRYEAERFFLFVNKTEVME